MSYIVTIWANKGYETKTVYSLRIVIPRPVLQELTPEVFQPNKPKPVFVLNLAKRDANGNIEPFYKEYGYAFGLERFIGSMQEYSKLDLGSQKSLSKFGRSFGFSLPGQSWRTPLEALGLRPGIKLECEVVKLREPMPNCDDKAILYRVYEAF